MTAYTKEELREFDKLRKRCGHKDQLKRILARLELGGFVKEHGREKCQSMFEFLKARDAKRRRVRQIKAKKVVTLSRRPSGALVA